MVPSIVLQDLRPDEAIVYEAKKSTQNQLSEVLMIPFSLRAAASTVAPSSKTSRAETLTAVTSFAKILLKPRLGIRL